MGMTNKEDTKKLRAEIEDLKTALNKKDEEISALKENIEKKEVEQKIKGYYVRREDVLFRAKKLFDNRKSAIMGAITDISNVHVILVGDGDYYYPRLENGRLELRYNNNDLMDVCVVSTFVDVFNTTVRSLVDDMHNKIIEALEKCGNNIDFADYPINNSFSG